MSDDRLPDASRPPTGPAADSADSAAAPVAGVPPLRPSHAGADLARRRRAHRTRHTALRWGKRALLALAGLAAALAVAYSWMPRPVVVDTRRVARTGLDVTVDEEGTTRVRERFVVAAPLSGTLVRIELEPGVRVEPGQVLTRLVPPDPLLLDARSRAEAEARLSAALARRQQAGTAIERVTASLEAALRDADRARRLAGKGAATDTELEQAELAERLARAAADATRLERQVAEAEVRTARAALGRIERPSREAMDVTAPAAGQVLRVLRESGGPVAAGTPLIELGDPRGLEVVIDVLSDDAARIPPGAPVSITRWGGERPLGGRVRMVEPSAFTRISALGIEEQRVHVVVALDQPPSSLGDGFRVEGRILVWRDPGAITVPSAALFRDHQRWAVYAVEDGRARLRPITVGRRGIEAVQVVGGIPVGTEVVVNPGDRVTDGARVEPR